jgi:RNA polymerase sigma factor (sigma-70 family)
MSLDDADNFDDLVKQAAAGDTAALSTLLVIVQGRLKRFILRRMPLDLGRQIEPVDVVQETLATAFRKVDGLKIQTFGGFVAWVNAIAEQHINMARRKYRAIKRGGNVQHNSPGEEELGQLLAFLSRNTKSPRDQIATRELVDVLGEAVDDLDTDYWKVLRLRFIEGKSAKDVGAELGKNEGAIRMLTLRALRHLRATLPIGSSTGRSLAS